jgi:anti-sigma B factor antagonist
VVVEVAGDIDLDTAPRLREAIAVAIDEAAGGACVVDLTAVSYLGSTGLTALVDATREAAAQRAPLRIVVDANRPVIRPIEITGLDQVLHLYHSVEQALAESTS